VSAPWEPFRVEDAVRLLVGFPAPWWVAGGWAIDLHVERQTREHDNVDVVVLRESRPRARELDRPAELVFHLADHDGETVYAGPDETLRIPLAELVLRTADGVPYLRPEHVILHKSRTLRDRDEWDFENALPLLSGDARAWLRDRLPEEHPWRQRL
jgi:hypothetical protein